MKEIQLIFFDNCNTCNQEYPHYEFIAVHKNMCIECYCKLTNKKQLKVVNSIKKFYKRIDDLGGTVIGEYKGSGIRVECRCKNDHICNPIPDIIQKGNGMCSRCPKNSSKIAEQNFHDNIKKLGGTVIGKYTNNSTPVECKCKEGHRCNPTPSNIKQGWGMCKTCVGHDPETAEQNFRDNIKKLGGTVIGKYIYALISVKCICKEGHPCNPKPNSIQQGRGMCGICAENDSEFAKQNFHDNIKKLGGTVIGKYTNNSTPVECKCKEGHRCNPTPNYIQQGGGMCRICAQRDPETAEQNFRDNIKKLGGTVIGEYEGSDIPVKCICKEGHHCNPKPNWIQYGGGMCIICVGHDPETAEQNFIDNIKKLGGTVIGKYTKSSIGVECICKEGHSCNPTPNNIRQGHEMCVICSVKGYSKIAISWLNSISNTIQHAENGGEFKIPNIGKVDGIDNETKTVYEYHGCFWHGCPKCYEPDYVNPINHKTASELYNKTIERATDIRNAGYILIEKWGCD